MKFYRRLFLISISLIGAVFAQSESNGRTGMAFLKIGVGARAAGMGGAFTAVTDNGFATYWNPAGLLAAQGANAAFMHNIWLLDANSDFGAIQFRGKKSAFGFHIYSFYLGDIEVRTRPSSEPLEKTNGLYISSGLSYARQLNEKLGVGITLKYLYEKIFVHSAAGVGVDLGLRYEGLLNNLVLAAALQNLGKMGKFNHEETKLPKILRAGAQYILHHPLGPASVLLAADVVKPLEENLRFHFGAEVGLWQQLILRLGYAAGYESRNISFGVGFRKRSFHIDYSLTPFQDDLGEGHRFSFYLSL